MSTHVPESQVQAPSPPDPVYPRAPRPRRRRLVLGAAVLLVAAGGAVVATNPFGGRPKAPTLVGGNTALAAVRQGQLSSQVSQSGTLSHSAWADGTPYTVINQASGIYTRLPSSGDQIDCGKTLAQVGGNPVVLLCGTTPAYRTISEGDSGKDVRELNNNLVQLGYADRADLDPTSDDFTWATTNALEKLQDKLGVDETGTLTLGAAVFLPGPLRITQTMAGLGTKARPDQQVAQATSNARQVTVQLDASQQTQVKVGDSAQITLPDNRTTAGVVSRIGTVATSASGGSGSGSSSSGATLPIYISLKSPGDAGSLDQAPVQVQITTAGVQNATIVPVTALVGEAGGGFAVEKVDAKGVHHMVPVTLGLFDDANGLVQVTGNLSAGDQVVVPST